MNMKKLTIAEIVLFFLLFPFVADIGMAQSPAVKIYEIEEEILEHNQLPLNPYPPFGLLTGYITYPYQFYGSKYFQIDKRKIKILVAENEYLKIGMAPDYGGRLWFIYDKIRNREVIHRNYKEAKFYNSGMGYQYLGGGMELNIPNAHSQTNARLRKCIMKENDDGSVSLIMSNTEKIGRLHWSVTFTLSPGEALIRQDVRVANETRLEERYLYWANCGIPVNENTEFIYPENSGALHGEYENEVSWPIYANKDISILKNVDEAVGFYMLNAREGYMGYYNHDEQFGLVHYADVNDLPGKKYWSWGWHVTALEKRFTHAEDVNYGEIQSGRIVIQEKFDKIAPMSTLEFTHYWYPVGAIGSFNGASENAAVNFRMDKITEARAVANIKIQANKSYENPKLLLKQNDRIIKEIALSSLSPQMPVSLSEEFELKNINMREVALYLVDKNGEPITNVLSRSEKPVPYDSYFNAHKHAEQERKDFTAEGLFAKAEVLFNDWFYHLPEIKEILKEVLIVDPGFSRAHTELGLMDLRGGELDEALEYFNMSLNRIPDDGRTLYYKGLTLMYMGNFNEAEFFLRRSGRFGYEYPERIAEAEMAIMRNDLNKANIHLEKAVSVNGNILKGHIFKALVEARLGNSQEAVKFLALASSLDAENPIVFCTDYLIKKSDKSIAGKIASRYENFPDELLEVVVTFYGAGFIEEAFQTLNLVQKTNSMVELYRAELESLTGKKSRDIGNTSVTAEFAWRLEEYFILKRKIKQNPEDAGSYYCLGNFMYAHDFEMDGINYWKKAHELGYNDKVMLISLYLASSKLGYSHEAYEYLLEAYRSNKSDPYIFEYYVDEVHKREGLEKAIALMEERYDDFENDYSLKAKLMNTYMNSGHYDKLEALLLESNLHDTHRLSFGEFWKNLKMAEGYNLLREEKYSEALEVFTKSVEVPGNIAQHYMPMFISQARRLFYMGYCNAKLGKQKIAEELWEDALKLKRDSKYQAAYKFRDLKTVYYQAFCLKGLGRYDEAERYITLLEDYARSTSLKNNPDAQKMLLTLSITGLADMDDFEKWDSDLGLIKINANFNAPEE
jgi:tetratricopeptide (TPR) repeat protein